MSNQAAVADLRHRLGNEGPKAMNKPSCKANEQRRDDGTAQVQQSQRVTDPRCQRRDINEKRGNPVAMSSQIASIDVHHRLGRRVLDARTAHPT